MDSEVKEKSAVSSRLFGRWAIPFYYGWVIVGVVFVAEFFASGMGGLTIGLFYTPIHDSLGWSLTMFTGAVTAASIGGIVVTPFLGPLLDRIGARPVMLFGAIAAGLGMLLLAQVREVWQFWILYAFVAAMGLHELGSFTGPVVVSKWFVKHRGRAMATAMQGNIIGGMIMTPVIGFLIQTVGWRQTWMVMGITLLAVMAPLVFAFVRRQPEDLGLLPDGASAVEDPALGKKATAPAAQEVMWTLKEALRTRSLWILIFCVNLTSFAVSVQNFHIIPFLTEQKGMTAGAASLILTMRLAAITVGRIPWGFVVERLPIRYCLAFSFVTKSGALLALAAVPYPWGIGFFVLLSGLGGAQAILQPLAFASYYGRKSQGTIQGALRPFFSVPSLIGPMLVAILYDVLGSFNTPFIVASVIGVTSGFLAVFATPPVKRGPAPVGVSVSP